MTIWKTTRSWRNTYDGVLLGGISAGLLCLRRACLLGPDADLQILPSDLKGVRLLYKRQELRASISARVKVGHERGNERIALQVMDLPAIGFRYAGVSDH